jgi:hypothetical protein
MLLRSSPSNLKYLSKALFVVCIDNLMAEYGFGKEAVLSSQNHYERKAWLRGNGAALDI